MPTFPSDPRPPLHDVRVLDAARVLAGPFCGQFLGDLGADVIKVERPGTGDETRGWGPPFLGDLSAYFLSCNRNKRSVTLDVADHVGLRQEGVEEGVPVGVGDVEGDALFHALLAKSDVLIENFRTDSAEKL